MISRLGLAISRVFYKVCPDPFVIAILLTILTIVLALTFGNFTANNGSVLDRAETLLDAWRSDKGFWKLLQFGMKMCLVLVTGHALAATRPVRVLIHRLAALPRSSAGGAVIVCIVACLTGLLNWGLALVVGALMAREVGRSLTRRGFPVHYPLLAAAGYMGLLIFHGGFSGSAPLTATTIEGARSVLPESALPLLHGGIPLDRTLFSPLNLFVTGGLAVVLPLLFWLLNPKHLQDMQPMPGGLSDAPSSNAADVQAAMESNQSKTIPDRLDRSAIIVWLLAIPLALAVFRTVQVSGWKKIDLNEVNAAMLALGLVLHGSPRDYLAAIEDGARDCAGIIIQFPIYAGIMGLMDVSGLAQKLSEALTSMGNQHTLPALSFVAATIVGLFVPSGGAQWGLQGPVALQSAAEAGADPGAMLMSVAYGDELANMLQPFWALPLLAITGVRARDIVGYTAIAMFVAGAWMMIGLLAF